MENGHSDKRELIQMVLFITALSQSCAGPVQVFRVPEA